MVAGSADERRAGLSESLRRPAPSDNGKADHVVSDHPPPESWQHERRNLWRFRVGALLLAAALSAWAIVRIGGALDHIAAMIQLK